MEQVAAEARQAVDYLQTLLVHHGDTLGIAPRRRAGEGQPALERGRRFGGGEFQRMRHVAQDIHALHAAATATAATPVRISIPCSMVDTG